MYTHIQTTLYSHMQKVRTAFS